MLATFSDVKFVQTPVLNIGYEEHGDESGFPIILLHGFPYDVRSWDGVAPLLDDFGYRILVPYLRGYGPTTLLDPSAPRMAEQAAIGQDVIDFANGLNIDINGELNIRTIFCSRVLTYNCFSKRAICRAVIFKIAGFAI